MPASVLTVTLKYNFFFFFNDTATTEIYTLSLHDALPILIGLAGGGVAGAGRSSARCRVALRRRSEEHTSELQSRLHLVCRLLLEKKKKELFQISLFVPENGLVIFTAIIAYELSSAVDHAR